MLAARPACATPRSCRSPVANSNAHRERAFRLLAFAMEPIMTALLDVRYFPAALADADARFARLHAEIRWDDRMRARRTASFGRPYNYSGQVYDATPMPPLVAEIAARAAELAGHPFDNCLCNLYET